MCSSPTRYYKRALICINACVCGHILFHLHLQYLTAAADRVRLLLLSLVLFFFSIKTLRN